MVCSVTSAEISKLPLNIFNFTEFWLLPDFYRGFFSFSSTLLWTYALYYNWDTTKNDDDEDDERCRLLVYCTEHIISIVASLIKNCEGIQRQRLINKFVENDHEKIDRLMELHFKYLDRVNKADDKIEQKKRVSFLFISYRFMEPSVLWRSCILCKFLWVWLINIYYPLTDFVLHFLFFFVIYPRT